MSSRALLCFIPSALLFLLLVGLALFPRLRHARATTDTALFTLGSTISKSFHGPNPRRRQLRLNGNIVSFSTRTVDAPVDRVISAYRRSCNHMDASVADALSVALQDQASGSFRVPLHIASVATDSQLRGSRGYVACLELGSTAIGLAALTRRFRRFAHSGNLGALGVARYVYATSIAEAPERTFVFEAAAKALDLATFINPTAAAGEHSGTLSPPPGAVLVLGAEELDADSRVSVYSSDDSASYILEHYQRVLLAAGWRLVDVGAFDTPSRSLRGVVVGSSANQTALVSTHQTAPDRTVFTILRTGAE